MRRDPEWALFLDFDGTLVEIAERPDEVEVAPGLSGVLSRLRDTLDGALALVSGRSIAVLDRFMAPLSFDAAGLHGVEYRLAGRLSPCRPEKHPALRAALAALPERIPPHPGILIEDKGCSFAVHWRLAPDAGDEVMAVLEPVIAALGPEYRLQRGKAVAELLPAHAAKGPIIAYFLTKPPYRGRRPIFIGDDLTDEHGFETVNDLGGVTIRIGNGRTGAQHRIATPAALRERLAAWAAAGRIDLDMLAPA
jgi:trehalose 6-phosphate phosphatase